MIVKCGHKTVTRHWGVTLLELMVVVVIISILATVATGVYSGKVQEAKIAAGHAQLHELEVAITRYEIDLGTLPPSGSGETVPPTALANGATGRSDGSGYLHLVLMHSMSGSAVKPSSALWKGPYLSLQNSQIQAVTKNSASAAGMTNILDPWGSPIRYIAAPDYPFSGTTFSGGTRMFSGAAPTGANPNLPAPNPYAATESFYNPTTYQLISLGPDAKTLGSSTSVSDFSTVSQSYAGADEDDITNFSY